MTDTNNTAGGGVSDAEVEAAHVAYERYGQAGDLMTMRLSDGCIRAILSASHAIRGEGWRDIGEGARDILQSPWDGQTVLIAIGADQIVGEAYYDHERDEWNWANTHWTDATGHSVIGVTHWQPLPQPPQEG